MLRVDTLGAPCYGDHMTTNQYAYIVSHGEQCEGGKVNGVFFTLADAKKFGDDKIKRGDVAFADEWSLDPFWPAIERNKVWEKTAGCDYIRIEKWKVQ